MENLGAAVGVIGFFSLMTGLVMLIPTAALRPRRKLALRLAGGGLAGFVLGLVLTPNKPATEIGAARPNATAPAADHKAQQTAKEPAVKAAAASFYRSVIDAAKPCDVAGKASADVIQRMSDGRASAYDGYDSATDQVEACGKSYDAYGRLSVPQEFSGELKDNAKRAISECRDYVLLKQNFGRTMQTVMDGETKPSTVRKFHDDAAIVQRASLACVGTAIQAAVAGGVNAGDLGKI